MIKENECLVCVFPFLRYFLTVQANVCMTQIKEVSLACWVPMSKDNEWSFMVSGVATSM